MARVANITFACENAVGLAEFWCRLYFQRKEKTPTTTAPIHIDVQIAAGDDREAELARFRQLGASFVETRSRSVGRISETWTIMRDPEGTRSACSRRAAERVVAALPVTLSRHLVKRRRSAASDAVRRQRTRCDRTAPPSKPNTQTADLCA